MLIKVVLFSSLMLCVLVAILIYFSKAPFVLKLTTLPTAIALMVFSLFVIVFYTGAPIYRYPEGKWDYISHTISKDNNHIILFIWTPKFEDFRLYSFPYDREKMKKLEEAKKTKTSGIAVKGQILRGKQGQYTLNTERGQSERTKNVIKR